MKTSSFLIEFIADIPRSQAYFQNFEIGNLQFEKESSLKFYNKLFGKGKGGQEKMYYIDVLWSVIKP